MGKSGPFGQVIQFCPKKAQKSPEMVDNFSYFLTLKGAGRQPNDTKSTLWYPWQLVGITVQTGPKSGEGNQVQSVSKNIKYNKTKQNKKCQKFSK